MDCVFTYGPLGFMTVPFFSGHAGAARMVFDALYYAAISLGVCLIAWRLSLAWRCLMLGLFILLPAAVQTGPDLPVEASLLCWGLLCLLEPNRRIGIRLLALAAIAATSSLGKFTLLVDSVLTVGIVACDLLLRGHRRLAIGLVAGCVLGWIGGWLLLGQSLWHVKAYFVAELAITNGYEQAMGVNSSPNVWAGTITMTLLALAVVAIRSLRAYAASGPYLRLRRGLLFVWLSAFVCLSWKHGIVRTGCHMTAATLPVLVFSLESVPSQWAAAKLWTRSLGMVCCLCAILVVHWKLPDYFKDYPGSAAHQFAFNAGALLRPCTYLRERSSELQSQADRAALPKTRQIVGQASVDVFGFNQGYAIFNRLNYKPRPVFQTYSVYNASLMRRNDEFYYSKDSPEFVLFRLASIDARYPPLEDSYTFRNLLCNYVPAEAEGPFLLLKRRQSQRPKLTLLREASVTVHEPIRLVEFGDTDIWMEIDVNPSFGGRIRSLLSQPSEVYLAAWNNQGPVVGFRAPVPMLAAGFLASPFETANADVLSLYTGNQVQRPAGWSVELPPGTDKLWQDSFAYRLYKIENKLGRSAPPEMMRLIGPGVKPAPAS